MKTEELNDVMCEDCAYWTDNHKCSHPENKDKDMEAPADCSCGFGEKK